MVFRFYGGPMAGQHQEVRDEDLSRPYHCRTWEAKPLSIVDWMTQEPAISVAGSCTTHLYDFKCHPYHGWGFYYREKEE